MAHHNRTHTSSLGCSPYFASYGEVPKLRADNEPGISDRILLTERCKTAEERYRKAIMFQFDKRRQGHIPDVGLHDLVPVRKGLPASEANIF